MDNCGSKIEKEKGNIHKEFLLELEKIDPQFFLDQKNNIKEFFWLCNPDPDEIKDQLQWAPYEREDNIYIEYCYQQFLKKTPRITEIGDYVIDFEKWFQYHKYDTWRQRRVIRTSKDKIKLIYRKSRFSYNNFMGNFDPVDIKAIKMSKKSFQEKESKKIGTYEIVSLKSDIAKEIHKNFSTMVFDVIPLNSILFFILKDFEEFVTFKMRNYDENFEEFKEKLIEEIDIYADSIKRYNIYKNDFLIDMNEENFWYTILKMYTQEGFLYRVVNKVLREKNKEEFQKIQIYYICLLAAFERCSSEANKRILTDPNIPEEVKETVMKKGKLYLYRGCFVTQKEIEYFEQDNHRMRIFNDFISCSLDKEVAKTFVNNCLIELELDFKVDEKEKKFFTFLNEGLTMFKNEKEILLKSGIIIHFQSIKENEDQGKIKYILKGKVISYNQEEFLTYDIKNLNNDTLNLYQNNLGSDPKNLEWLSEGLKNNFKVKNLILWENNLGSNPDNLKWLYEVFKYNSFITKLNLWNNNLGSNPDNIKWLSEGLKLNSSITRLNLRNNNLASDRKNLELLGEGLKCNSSINELELQGNDLPSNDIEFLKNLLGDKIFKISIKY